MFTDFLIPTYVQMLGALSAWLDKAQRLLPAERAEALLSARLAPDMYPLSTQIRFACVQALEGVARLEGMELPETLDSLLNEGRNAAEYPGTMADAQKRIDETLAVLASRSPDALDTDPQGALVHALPNGMVFDLTAQQYARDWTVPQFYFHIMIAYAILRAQGVDLGKADYVAHVLAFLRQPVGSQA